jgi:hypothetical protein
MPFYLLPHRVNGVYRRIIPADLSQLRPRFLPGHQSPDQPPKLARQSQLLNATQSVTLVNGYAHELNKATLKHELVGD